jgi:hypothetical protein
MREFVLVVTKKILIWRSIRAIATWRAISGPSRSFVAAKDSLNKTRELGTA